MFLNCSFSYELTDSIKKVKYLLYFEISFIYLLNRLFEVHKTEFILLDLIHVIKKENCQISPKNLFFQYLITLKKFQYIVSIYIILNFY